MCLGVCVGPQVRQILTLPGRNWSVMCKTEGQDVTVPPVTETHTGRSPREYLSPENGCCEGCLGEGRAALSCTPVLGFGVLVLSFV